MKIVEAKSVQDYLERYYKKSRWTPTLVDSYVAEYKRDGYICTSRHDNVTGEFILWAENTENIPSFLHKGRKEESK